MAFDRGGAEVRTVPDVGRWVALRTHGALRFLDRIDAAVQDIEGALDQGQFGPAAFQARRVVLLCLSIRSLAAGGEVDLDDDSVSFDFFAGLPADAVRDGLGLANEAVGLDRQDAGAWFQRLRAYLADTERILACGAPLPMLRSREGAFGIIGLVRRWGGLLNELGYPPLLQSDWTGPQAASAASRAGAARSA